MVTRPAGTGNVLIAALEAAGAEVVRVPLITIEPPEDGGAALEEAVAAWDDFDWIAITSASAVEVLARRLGPRLRGEQRWAAVGRRTAAALKAHGVDVAVVPDEETSAGLARCLGAPSAGPRLLLAQAEQPAGDLAATLEQAGWHVTPVAVYRTAPAELAAGDSASLATADLITLASGSAASSLVRNGISAVAVVCIGPRTAAAARDLGLTVAAVASERTDGAFVEAVVAAIG